MEDRCNGLDRERTAAPSLSLLFCVEVDEYTRYLILIRSMMIRGNDTYSVDYDNNRQTVVDPDRKRERGDEQRMIITRQFHKLKSDSLLAIQNSI